MPLNNKQKSIFFSVASYGCNILAVGMFCKHFFHRPSIAIVGPLIMAGIYLRDKSDEYYEK